MYKQHALLRKDLWTDADRLEYMELNIAPYSRYWRMGMKKALKHAIRLLREEEATTDRKTEPTHDLRTKTHECVKDTHDKTSPNSSEKPNNSTISKMEQVEDEPLTCSFSDCDNFKNPDYARCIECKRKQIELKTEPNSSEIPTGSTTKDCSVVEERSSE